ncbi:MAG: hypothetical protein JWN10_1230 [Solirubrobacterales bacterium]|nr:hypothetical protein [Solirubrobacterales bacterium]
MLDGSVYKMIIPADLPAERPQPLKPPILPAARPRRGWQLARLAQPQDAVPAKIGYAFGSEPRRTGFSK